MLTSRTTLPMLIGAICTNAALGDMVGIVNITSSNGFNQTASLDGIPLGDGSMYWTHQLNSDDFTVSTTMVGNPEAASIGTVLQVVNGSTAMLQFNIAFSMTLEALPVGISEWVASQSVTLGGIDSTLSSIIDLPLWSVTLGDVETAVLFETPFSLNAGSEGSIAVAQNGSGSVFLTGGDSLGVHYHFELDAGATVAFSGGFATIPVPASIALLGCWFIPVGRRRR